MKKIKIYASWDLALDIEFEKQIDLYVDGIPNIPRDKDKSIRIVLLCEPSGSIKSLLPLKDSIEDMIINNQHFFDYVFTYNPYILKNCQKASFFTDASCWIKDYSFPKKEFSVSTVVGHKMLADGHAIRHKLWYKQNKIKCQKRFFLSRNHEGVENFNNNPILSDSKDILFDSQFHIAIESNKLENYFTEKLIDTLSTKTIPIYYGCPNISNWFNTKGIIQVNDLNEIINACNSLTSETYDSMKEYVEENYKKALEFKDMRLRLKNKILETVNKK